jgi:hypothetical protein
MIPVPEPDPGSGPNASATALMYALNPSVVSCTRVEIREARSVMNS